MIGRLTLRGYVGMRWYDEYRVWNTSFPYNCISQIVIPHNSETKAWIPELTIINAEDRWELTRSVGEKLAIHDNGYTLFSPGGVISIECTFDLTMFPFDTQYCTIFIEDWRYSSRFVRLLPDGEGYHMIRVAQLEQWTVKQGSSNFEGVLYTTNESYGKASFTVELIRKPGYYMINTIIPSIFISITELITFSIPVYSETRLELSFTCLLAYGIFQGYVAADLPRSADNPPLLSIYIVIMSAFIFLTTFFHGITRTLFSFSKSMSNTPMCVRRKDPEQNAIYWKRMAKKWDRIALTISTTFVILTTIIFFFVLPYILN